MWKLLRTDEMKTSLNKEDKDSQVRKLRCASWVARDTRNADQATLNQMLVTCWATFCLRVRLSLVWLEIGRMWMIFRSRESPEVDMWINSHEMTMLYLRHQRFIHDLMILLHLCDWWWLWWWHWVVLSLNTASLWRQGNTKGVIFLIALTKYLKRGISCWVRYGRYLLFDRHLSTNAIASRLTSVIIHLKLRGRGRT